MVTETVIINGHRYVNNGQFLRREEGHHDCNIDDDLRTLGWSRKALKTFIQLLRLGDGSGAWPAVSDMGNMNVVLRALGVYESPRPKEGTPLLFTLGGERERLGLLICDDGTDTPYEIFYLNDEGNTDRAWCTESQVRPLDSHPWSNEVRKDLEIGTRVMVKGFGPGTIIISDGTSKPYKIRLDNEESAGEYAYWADRNEVTVI